MDERQQPVTRAGEVGGRLRARPQGEAEVRSVQRDHLTDAEQRDPRPTLRVDGDELQGEADVGSEVAAVEE